MDGSTQHLLEDSYLETIEKVLGTDYNQDTANKEGAPRRGNEDGINGKNGRRHCARQNSGGSEIAAPAKISNAFAIETEVTARPLSGNERFQLFLVIYQGRNGAGYHVIFVQRGQ